MCSSKWFLKKNNSFSKLNLKYFWHTVLCFVGKLEIQLVFVNCLRIKSICQGKSFLSRKIIRIIICSNLNCQFRSSRIVITARHLEIVICISLKDFYIDFFMTKTKNEHDILTIKECHLTLWCPNCLRQNLLDRMHRTTYSTEPSMIWDLSPNSIWSSSLLRLMIFWIKKRSQKSFADLYSRNSTWLFEILMRKIFGPITDRRSAHPCRWI